LLTRRSDKRLGLLLAVFGLGHVAHALHRHCTAKEEKERKKEKKKN
jgi:hypothetical protein